MTTTDSDSRISTFRLRLVERAVRQWIAELVDLGGRNNLLHFRELKLGTLSLTQIEARHSSALLKGQAVRVSALFPEPNERERALRRLRTISAKAKENLEERGLETLHLAFGLCSWENKRGSWEPSAPVLLQTASLKSVGAALDEFELMLTGEMEINPVLLQVLKTDFDCDCDPEDVFARTDGVIDEKWEIDAAFEWLTKKASRVPRFSIKDEIVLANFSYAKLPMVRDLENSTDELGSHEIIAAIAGDDEARASLTSGAPSPDSVPTPDRIKLADEFLILDADSSQSHAINAAVAGANLIVKGPPGTGKSQSIANMIASLTARGRKVLFVAEKRAAIDAVLKRLHERKLDDVVLNLHGGLSSRRAFADNIGRALQASRTVPPMEVAQEQRRVELRRSDLNKYVQALHSKRQPWNISVYEIRNELLARGATEARTRFVVMSSCVSTRRQSVESQKN